MPNPQPMPPLEWSVRPLPRASRDYGETVLWLVAAAILLFTGI